MRGDVRGVSTVLGVVLLLGMVFGGMMLVMAVGGTALDETRNGLDTGRAEKALTQFDSRSSMVALGGTSRQGVDLAAGNREGYRVDPEAGWMNVTVYNASADEHTEVANVTLGAVVYENGAEVVAYQGGGVWKSTEAGVAMLSPPEFHFRDATLTLPLITVDGDRQLGKSAEVTTDGSTQVRYPNQGADENFTNPMQDGHVNVTVHSEYYEAWGGYFERRTEGDVDYDHDEQTARAKLVVPFDESYENALATTEPGGIDANGGTKPDPFEEGVNYPSADSRIEDKISTCESGMCDETTDFNDIETPGTYYNDGDYTGKIDVEDPGGNVTIVINGDLKKPGSIDITASDPHRVTIFVAGSFTINKDINTDDGDPGELAVVLHSDGTFSYSGSKKFTGLVYAPGSFCKSNGGGADQVNVEGGAVCSTADINGNPNEFDYDPAIQNHALGLEDDISRITYLHVTENAVNVTSD